MPPETCSIRLNNKIEKHDFQAGTPPPWALISLFNTVSSSLDSDIPITAAFLFDAIIFTSSIFYISINLLSYGCHGNSKNENFKNSYITFLDNRSEKVCMKFQPYLTRSLTGSSHWVIFAVYAKKCQSLYFSHFGTPYFLKMWQKK